MSVTMVVPAGIAAAGGSVFLPDGTKLVVDANGRASIPNQFVSEMLDAGWATWVPRNLYGTDDGTTKTLAAAKVTGAEQMVLRSGGGSTPTLTFPLATDLVAALPNTQVGFTYRLRVINNNSGTLTVANNTGVTLSGTLTLAQNTWRDFILTLGAGGLITGQAVGTGTDS
jgi:hypothetical protein